MTFFQDAKQKAQVFFRERKERAEAKKATGAAMNSEHGHGRFFLLHVPAMATICAAVVEWYWAILFCIEATGGIDWNYQTTTGSAVAAASTWNFAFETHWPIFLGLVCATIPIVMLSMVWLPVQFAMRGTGMWRRGTVIAVGVLANILVIVSGTVVMNGNRQEQVRAGLVVEQQAQANRGAIEAQVAAVNDDLARLTDRRVNNEYAATAANVGAVAYRAQYMSPEALARSPESRRDIIVRALGAAERADALRAERAGLFQQMAQAPTEAAVAANVEDEVGAGLNTFAQIVEVWRPPFVAVICCLIGIFGAWWVLALMQGLNPRDVLRSGWADEAHRIEDHSEEAPIAVDPAGPVPPRQRRKVYNPDTGREEVFVQPKGYWRATGKTQRNADGTVGEVNEFVPEAAPDETGVEVDGGNRSGSVAQQGEAQEYATDDAPINEQDAPQAEGETSVVSVVPQTVDDAHPDPSTELAPMSDEELLTLPEFADVDAEPAIGSDSMVEQEASNATDDEADHGEPRTEPEQDERRLIAANVAAE